jgi:hypothetical protein
MTTFALDSLCATPPRFAGRQIITPPKGADESEPSTVQVLMLPLTFQRARK